MDSKVSTPNESPVTPRMLVIVDPTKRNAYSNRASVKKSLVLPKIPIFSPNSRQSKEIAPSVKNNGSFFELQPLKQSQESNRNA
jgi:hypothetical protein